MPLSAADLMQTTLLGEAIDNGPALVFVADEDMRYLAVNQYACDVLGYTRDELLELTVSEIASAPEAADLYADMLKTSSDAGVTELRRKDGTVLRMRYSAKETTAAAMTYWVAVGFIEP